MGRRNYSELKLDMDSEKGRMKKRLWDWGKTLDVCAWKQEELDRLAEIQETMHNKNSRGEKDVALEALRRSREENIKRLETEILTLLREKEWFDQMIRRLTEEEKQFVFLRFEKGYGFDFIGMKMYQSRATLFRMQDRILKKLMEMEVETP